MFDRRLEVPQGERPHEAADEVQARRLLFLIFRINDHPCQLKVVVVPQGGLEQSHFVRGRAHVLSSASVGPLGRLIVLGAGMQTCARTCAMGEDAAWMCVDPAEWRASLRRSENASQAEA